MNDFYVSRRKGIVGGNVTRKDFSVQAQKKLRQMGRVSTKEKRRERGGGVQKKSHGE